MKSRDNAYKKLVELANDHPKAERLLELVNGINQQRLEARKVRVDTTGVKDSWDALMKAINNGLTDFIKNPNLADETYKKIKFRHSILLDLNNKKMPDGSPLHDVNIYNAVFAKNCPKDDKTFAEAITALVNYEADSEPKHWRVVDKNQSHWRVLDESHDHSHKDNEEPEKENNKGHRMT